jgi:lactam utilization protein B
MDYQEIINKYTRIEIPLDEIKKKVNYEINEIETISGKEEDTKKQLNTHKMIYMMLTIIMVIFLILSVNFKLK